MVRSYHRHSEAKSSVLVGGSEEPPADAVERAFGAIRGRRCCCSLSG